MIDRLIDACCRINYPRDRFEIQVLDDSTDETVVVARDRSSIATPPDSPAWLPSRSPISIARTVTATRRERSTKDSMSRKGELVAIFDADFVPPPEWAMQVVHHFAEPEIGMVQTRWTHLNRDYSFMTQVEAIMLDGHFVLEHGGRSRAGVFFNFNGTAGMWRRETISQAGGWQHDTLTEDTDLSYRAQMVGMEVQIPAGCGVPG